MVFEYRVTKYDPQDRDSAGRFRREVWTSFNDIGRVFGGEIFSKADYEAVEDKYVSVAVAFMKEAGVELLRIKELENPKSLPQEFEEGRFVTLDEASVILREMLRDHFWCRLESVSGFIHVGYDFYMYLGVLKRCPVATVHAGKMGLFVESFRSPYHEQPSS